MEEIKRQVARARRRMNGGEFLRIVAWSLTVTLAVALIGIAIPRLWVLEVNHDVWTWSWVGGSLAAGLIAGGIIAYVRRRDDLAAAIEIDRRYGLKERIASSLSLAPAERESDFGQALLSDAARRVERIDVREHFQFAYTWKMLLPLIPIAAMFALILLVPPAAREVVASNTPSEETSQRIKKAAAELEKKVSQKKEEMKKEGLKEAVAALEELQRAGEKLKTGDANDRKDALVKMNDMAKDLQKKRDDLAMSKDIKKQLADLKDLDKGPGEKLADALKEGDLGKAAEEMKKLMDKVRDGELNKEDREKLAKQLDQMKDKIEQMQAAREQKKKELEEQLEQKKNAGDLAEAAKLQDQLDQMKAQDQKMNQMAQKLADKLGQASRAMKEGGEGKQGNQQAQQAMKELAEDLQQMQDQLAQADALDEAMNEIDDAKEAMNCEQCKGAGCKACQGKKQGQGQGQGKGQKDGEPGDGLGEGRGKGARPEEKTDTKGFNSRVRMKAQKGKSTRIGDAGGPNLPGKSTESVRAEVEASLAKEPESLDETALPRDLRDHTSEYFEKVLKGE